ncbi:MAG: tRNA (adenine(22)-N(1))-methyltransferase TrmK [Bdellovibrionaceae bacterium]|nr:tRNA (adenine(22)-N(1))-methyltransferase TrmK [Pseudobdellovibrionaceae bacterium]
MKNPKRLQRIYELADGPELWDIGCDHSLLARINAKVKKFSMVYCVDKSKASLNKILNEAKDLDFQTIKLVCADGCDLNWPDVSGSVVIAGVGGNTVINIVTSCPIKFRKKITWILNPFTSVDKFVKEIEHLFPNVDFERISIQEKSRECFIFKFSKS